MRILVTAGNTQAPVDRVRCLTNIFSGRTGTRIALEARQHGHAVGLLTSHPEVVRDLAPPPALIAQQWHVGRYRTFDELGTALAEQVTNSRLDALIHTAAVSDYLSAGVYAAAAGTQFDAESGTWSGKPEFESRAAGKIRSDEPELWLRLVRAPKLIDMIRRDWKFQGVLVKFKLEAGVSDEQLQAIAERARVASAADLMVANTLEGAKNWALFGPIAGRYVKLPRLELASSLVAEVERIHAEKANG
jgi:phosphopantothenate-cysteine ligase/phosphopantothenoylcysteine decarboxylase/phosphopantothenate--cysteine ligase